MAGRILLLRHGQTEWARDGRHTGRTDIPLTGIGEQQAVAAGAVVAQLLDGHPPALVLTSPLQRAARTAKLAGLDAQVEPGLAEWDYGAYEGLTSAQIQAQSKPDWTIFADGVSPGATPGESLTEVADRVTAVLARVEPDRERGDVVLVAHGHSLRVLAACWLGADPHLGAQLPLDPAGVCVLAQSHELPALVHWNLPAAASTG